MWEVCASQSADFIVFVTPSLLSLIGGHCKQITHSWHPNHQNFVDHFEIHRAPSELLLPSAKKPAQKG